MIVGDMGSDQPATHCQTTARHQTKKLDGTALRSTDSHTGCITPSSLSLTSSSIRWRQTLRELRAKVSVAVPAILRLVLRAVIHLNALWNLTLNRPFSQEISQVQCVDQKLGSISGWLITFDQAETWRHLDLGWPNPAQKNVIVEVTLPCAIHQLYFLRFVTLGFQKPCGGIWTPTTYPKAGIWKTRVSLGTKALRHMSFLDLKSTLLVLSKFLSAVVNSETHFPQNFWE